MFDNQRLDLNLYEITLSSDCNSLPDNNTLTNLFFECQCAILMIDISNPISFDIIKQITTKINQLSLPYLTLLLIITKTDIVSPTILSKDIKDFLDNHQQIQSFEISFKNPNKDTLNKLTEIIFTIVNHPKNKIALNIVKRCSDDTLKNQYSIRCVLLGDSAVGKTSMVSRHFHSTFRENFLSTIGIDDFNEIVKIRNDIYKLQLWDTAGQERFRALPKKYYLNADGILLLFSLDSMTSFNNIERWIVDIQTNINRRLDGSDQKEGPMTTIFLIGNKSDLIEDREVSREDAEAKAKQYNVEYYEMSCKDNLNIDETIANMMMKCYAKSNGIVDCFSLEDVGGKKGRENGCCK